MNRDAASGANRPLLQHPATNALPKTTVPQPPMPTNDPSEKRGVPVQCEKEPIHIINRIQPCGYLINVDRDLTVVQCSENVVELLPPPAQVERLLATLQNDGTNNECDGELLLQKFQSLSAKDHRRRSSGGSEGSLEEERAASLHRAALDYIVGRPLSILLGDDDAGRVKSVIEGVYFGNEEANRRRHSGFGCEGVVTVGGSGGSRGGAPKSREGRHPLPDLIQPSTQSFLMRSKGTVSFSGRLSCSILSSSATFLLELEKTPTPPRHAPPHSEDRDIMAFMEEISKELRKCWSIEEMASLVCARVMSETPYDRGMVYKFDHEDCGEVVYETFRSDARDECRRDSFLGLRFPASDIPRQARELFIRNTLRVVYDVDGEDFDLYPPRVEIERPSGEKEMGFTDLSMCRLRGSSYIHLKYLRNMGVTSTMVIAIIVNKKLWGLYSFHGYREPLVPSPRTRFLCEMASITTSIIMESLTRKEDNDRLMKLESAMNSLNTMPLLDFFEKNANDIMRALDVNLISLRVKDPPETPVLRTFALEDAAIDNKDIEPTKELTSEVFDSLNETYYSVCRDYGIVYIDQQKSNRLLADKGIHTLVFFQNAGVDVILSRSRTIERVAWGGDPDKKLEPDGTLTPRNSFAAYVKSHYRQGRPWDDRDRRLMSRFSDQLEKHRSIEMNVEHTRTIMALEQEKQQAVDIAQVNFDFFAHMAHELRTPFHGMVGSLEAMREDPSLRNNDLLKTAEQCGKSMVKILDDILLVAKGSYNFQLEDHPFDLKEFVKETVSDMAAFARMEGSSVTLGKVHVFHENVLGDHHRIRQVINNLVSNAVKFSKDTINVEVMQRKSFSEVIAVWKTYSNVYPQCEPSLLELSSTFLPHAVKHDNKMIWTIFSVVDKGIGISGADLKKLGTAFTQLSRGRQKKYQGTGLGLYICNMIVTALEGKLAIMSAEGLGSCFTFAIPIRPDEVGLAPAPKEDSSAVNAKDHIEQLQEEFDVLGLRERAVRVLVVDDSAINRKLCARKVRRCLPGVIIKECASGSMALEEYEVSSSDILGLFMDYHMHDMDGDECTRRIRESESMNEARPHVYIAGYTADVLENSTEKLLASGMDSVISKPEPPRAVEDTLRKMMNCYCKAHNFIRADGSFTETGGGEVDSWIGR